MSRPKREPRAVTVAEIAEKFELASYWFGTKWCPAVWKTETGYSIRILKSRSITSTSEQLVFDSFDLDPDGVITSAPRGHAKDWKPARVTDVAEVAGRYTRVGTNEGHGHVWPRPDGAKARCGGEGLCAQCRADAELVAGVIRLNIGGGL